MLRRSGQSWRGITTRLAAAFAVVAASLMVVPASVDVAGAQATCPAGTILGNARWGTTGTMVWQNSVANQNSGASQTYNNIAGGVGLTVSYTDPANVNEDLNNPYLNFVANDSWDSPIYTRTNGSYGANYFTIVMNSLRSDQVVDWSFAFTKPVFVPDFQVSDIDWAGYGYNNGNGTPHESFQDEVVLAAQRGGNTITFTATGGSGIVDLGGGQLVAGPYQPGVNGNVAPTDAAGRAVLSPSGPVTSFNMQYSNGPDDAAADALDGSPPSPIPRNSPGVSNNHAVAISGFTVCAGNLSLGDRVWADVDGDGIQDTNEPGIAGVTVTISDLDGNVIETQVTGANGAYLFTSFPPYDWVVSIAAPAGYTPTHDRDGGTLTSTQINPTSTELNIDFGLRPDPGTISGTVLTDRNDNGTLEAAASEVPLGGVTVDLAGTDLGGNAVSASTITAADGTYSFTGVPAGNYTVSEVQPAVGYVDGIDTPGTNAVSGGNDQHVVSLDPFESSIGNNFAEIPNSSIAGNVYEDLDNSGTLDGGESGIAGVSIALSGTDALGNTVSLTAVTQADGTYVIPRLISGSYTVAETQPAGYIDGRESVGSHGGTIGPDTFTAIPLPYDVDATGYDFGELLASSISGSVGDDGGNPIQNVTITLTGTDDLGNPISLTTTTAADGTYSFNGLRPGRYTITETQPAAYGDGPDQLGTINGTPEGTLGNDVISDIDLGVDEDGIDYDFSETRGSISGSVGDDGGNPIQNVAITLTGTDDLGNPISLTTTTAADGTYSFDDLVGGLYTVTETQPTGYGDGPDTAGTAGGDTSVNDQIGAITLPGGVDATGYDFEEARSSLSGRVFVDPENDGAFGTTGVPESGATITLTGTDDLGNTINRTTATGANGRYSFDDLLAGTYTITETQPAGLIDGIDTVGSAGGGTATNDEFGPITLGGGVDAAGYDFAELPPAGISGAVTDAVGNPIGGVTIDLTGTDDLGNPISQTTTTAADGTYVFFGLPPGTYTVAETQPIGYGDGPDSAGTVDGTNNGSAGNDVITTIALGPGSIGIDYDFTETSASIAGTVVDDGGGPIAGVTITLTGTDAVGTTINRSTTTAADGTYIFDDLLSGTYTVTETQPEGYGDGGETAGTSGGDDTVDDTISAITLPGGDSATGYDFDETRSAITGTVYQDLDNNGLQLGPEPGIGAVTITLSGTDVNGATVNATTTTDSGGAWSFTGLLAGTYTVVETQPVAYLDGAEQAGTGGGSTAVNDEISGISLGAGVVAQPYLFGELPPSSLSGVVYNDQDGSGAQNGSEPGIGGATVTLTGTDDLGAAVTVAMTTAADGSYAFGGLRPGTYTITETQPAGFIDGSDSIGTAGGDNSVNDTTSSISLAPDTDATGYDFGELEGASIAGSVVDDGGNPIESVTITLTGTDDLGAPVSMTTTTAADGTYRFDSLRPGTYTITETQPTAYGDGGETAGTAGGTVTNDTVSSIVLGSGDTETGYDFDETRGSLTGTVYVDTNNNGTQDTGEPGISGATVRLAGVDDYGTPVTLLTTTAADGTYIFTSLIGGGYAVRETQPAGYFDGIDAVGTAGGTLGNDEVTAITLPGGANATNYDFGELLASSITGTVTDDGANPIESVTITLTGTDDLGNAVSLTTTTAADGTYTFDNLRPGTYTITETQPTGYLDGPDSVGTSGGDNSVNDVISSVVLASDTDATGYDFGEVIASSITGSVVDDGGNPIQNVTLTLTGTDDLGAPVSLTTTTAADGTYTFMNLRPGTYTITETQPAAYGDGGETAGTINGSTVGDDTADDEISAIVLPAGSNALDYDFDETRGSLAGVAYIDTNNNGTQDTGEPGIAGAAIDLTGTDVNGNPVTAAITTAINGSYTFPDLLTGTYTITETQPAGHLDGMDSVGAAGGDNSVNDTITTINLPGGTNAGGYDFGELLASSLGGTVVDDAAVGIAGVTLTLTGTDDLGATVSMTTTTAADGTYRFDGLRPGTYTITETQPVGYLDGGETAGTAGGTVTNDTVSSIVLGSDTDATGYDFDEIRASSIAGSVVDDGGNPIQNVTLTLTGTDDIGAPVSLTTTTAADGTYRFDNLRPGTYTLNETQPAAYGDGGETAGTINGTNVGVVSNDQIAAIILPSNTDAVDYEFDETRGSLTGTVYDDLDANGTHNTGEPGIAGTTIELSGTDTNGNPVTASTTTAADGTYRFDDLLTGTYTITETQPTGYADGQDSIGTAGGDNSVNDTITTINLPGGINATNYDFGEVALGGLSGAVYIDTDNSGVFDAAEVGIAGVRLDLVGVDDRGAPVSLTTTTAADGSYSFMNLRPGTYTVTETQPAAYSDGIDSVGTTGGTLANDSISDIVLGSGDVGSNYDFGELEGASVGGAVVDDGGNPIQNVALTLSGTDDLAASVSLSTTTAPDGTYRFTGLRPGTYTITETQPPGYGDGGETAGTVDGNPVGDASSDDRITAIVLTSGAIGLDYDFDETRGSIAGSVYLDADGNGTRNGTESGIGGIDITLMGTDALGNPVARSTTTAADGTYVFPDLLSGDYAVTEPTQPSGQIDGREEAGTAGGVAGNTPATNDTITDIALGPGENATGYLFGEWDDAIIAGSVVDELGRPIPDVTIRLTGTDDNGAPVTGTVTTGTDGAYAFTGLAPGTYTIRESQPAAYGDGGEQVGTVNGIPVGTATDDQIADVVLGPNQNGIDYDFIETLGSLSGTVYDDADGNGIFGGGDIGIGGTTVGLTGTDANGAAVSTSTVTAADGTYAFTGLVGGTYTVTETQPAGYLDGSESAGTAGGDVSVNDVISNITTTGGADETGYDFGEIDAASVSGSVVDDGGNPIPGTTITLTGTDDLGATVLLTDTTDVTGVYSFDGLRPGTYTVTETQPVGYGDGGESAGPAGGIVTNDRITNIVLGPDTDAVGNDFDEIRSSISGSVFDDLDSDGMQQGGEPGISGVTITLTGTDDLGAAVTRTTTTDGSGDFAFTGLLSGTYTLTETQPTGFVDGADSAGTAGGDATTQNDQVSSISIGPGLDESGYTFAEVRSVALTGSVFVDDDNDGTRDGGESGIGSVTVNLSGLDDRGQAVSMSTVTAADGTYSFSGLRPGTYAVSEVQPAAYLDGIDSVGSAGGTLAPDRFDGIVLSSGESGTDYDFGELAPAAITGTVTDDVGAPITGVTLTLDGTDDLGSAVSITTTTAADGTYSFTGLRPGTYTVTETQPAAYADGGETAGTIGATSVGDDTIDDTISAITIGSGQTGIGYDFDELTGTISGRIFLDADSDTVPSAGDTDLGGVTVNLTGTDVDGAAVTATTTTAADGSYTFDHLLAGTYSVAETQPAGLIDAIDSPGSTGGTADNNPGGDLISGIPLAPGADSTDNNFSEAEAGSLSGSVVDDAGNGISGVTITLTGVDHFGTAVSITTTTAADGTYLFDLLAPGTYAITETQPAAYGDGGETAGTIGGTSVGDDTADDTISGITLGSGRTGIGYDFDETRMSISGTVVIDTNGNGSADTGESGIGGVTIDLTGIDANGAAVSATTTTAADGTYTFADLLAGTYTVIETQPAGYLDGGESAGSSGGTVTDDQISAVPLAPGVDATDYDFGEVEASSIGGTVLDDLARPIPGTTITLTGTDDLGAAVSATTTSATDGTYTFIDLRPGTYSITETQPIGYGDGGETAGTVNGVSVGDDTTNDQITGIVLAGGDAGIGYDFDETTAGITGAVVHVTGSGDAPISGVIVDLSGTDLAGATVAASTTTAADGTFAFDGLLAGDYTLTETQPAIFVDGPERVGTAGGDATVNDVISSILLAAGFDATGYDFTETGTVLIGRVWLDRTGDGAPDPSDDLDLSGILIELIGSDGSVVATTTTAPDGTYAIGGLAAGNYTVRQTQPPEWGSITPNDVPVALPVTGLSGVDFGEQAGAISGTVFGDTDLNGIDDQTTPRAGVAVTLTNAGGVVATTTTDAGGNYIFMGLPAGSYTVTITPPTGAIFTVADVGTDDAVDSDVDPTTGRVAVPLAPGQVVTDVDAGLMQIEQDVAIEITTPVTTVEVGDDVPFVITVTNTGNVPIVGGVTVTIPVPPGTNFVSATGTGWTITVGDGVVTATRPDTLAVGEAAPPITLVVTPNRPGTITATAQVALSSGQTETTQTNNLSAVPINVINTTTIIPNLAYTGGSLLLLLLIAGGLIISGRTLMLVGAPRRRDDD